jgi:hypothetical protein
MENANQLPAAVLISGTSGGSHVTVTKLDGTLETVFVRIVPLSQMVRYASTLDNICELVELVCEKPKGWADTIAVDDALRLDEEVRRLNDPIMGRVAKRQQTVAGHIVEISKGLDVLMKSLPMR